MKALHTLPKFSEWLIEDILERNYAWAPSAPKRATERYADTPDTPEWVRKTLSMDQWEPELTVARTGTPITHETATESTGEGDLEQPENGGNMLDPKLLDPAYQIGDTVYSNNRFFEISGITPSEIELIDKTTVPPLMTTLTVTRFEYLLRQDPRNLAVSDFLSTDTSRIRDDTREVLTAHLLTSGERDAISRWFRSGEGNAQIAGRISEMLSGRSGSVDVPGNVVAKYSADDKGLHVSHQLYAGFRTWEEVAAIYRTLWQQELDGFSHEPPAVDILETEQAEAGAEICVEKRSYDSLRELIDNELTALDFDELVRLKHDLPPEPERVEMDGGKVTPTPSPVTTKVVGRVDTGAFEVIFEEMRFGPEKHNFHITDDNLGVGGDKTKYQYNVAAIRTLKQIEAESRLATPEEQEILSRYVGWGGLAQAFDPDNEKWAREYAELKELLTPEEYTSARTTTVNAHYARFVP